MVLVTLENDFRNRHTGHILLEGGGYVSLYDRTTLTSVQYVTLCV